MPDLVSIIVPVYNMEKSIEACVSSLRNQEYKELEIILVDDGSTDKSYAICKQISARDSRVKCIHTDNRGSGPARNVGITASAGKYLYFPDADDFLEPNAISVLVDAMENGKYDLIVFGYRSLTHSGDVVSERKYEELEFTGESVRADYSDYFGMSGRFSIQGAPWNKFFDGESVRKYHIEYPALRRHQDECFISRYVTHCRSVRFITNVLYSYYQNTVSLEWKKYPADYADCVKGLNRIWQQTICAWNPRDHAAHFLVDQEIFSKLIKVLELSFSPKLQLGSFRRILWIRKTCLDVHLADYSIKVAGSPYQRAMLLSAKLHLYIFVMCGAYIGTIKNHVRQGK
jgi:glycosyltransferase involved in cell wall biosynthesis